MKRAILQANEVLHEQQSTINALAHERDVARQQTGLLLEEMDRERVHARHQIQAVISEKDALLMEKDEALNVVLMEKESAMSLPVTRMRCSKSRLPSSSSSSSIGICSRSFRRTFNAAGREQPARPLMQT